MMKRSSNLSLSRALAAVTLVQLLGCADGSTFDEASPAQIESTDEDREALFAQYRQAHVKKLDSSDGYLVEGDMYVASLAEVRADFDRQHAPAHALLQEWDGSAATLSQQPEVSKRLVTYCVSTDFGTDHATARDAIFSGLAAWEGVADVRYTYKPQYDSTCTDTNTNVTFNVRKALDGEGNSAGLPHQPRAAKRVTLDIARWRTQALPKPSLVAVATHEIGHTLGFRHEHIREQPEGTLYCNDYPIDAGSTSVADRTFFPLTGYDMHSVMHYASCPTANPVGVVEHSVSQRDADGAQRVYGAPTHVIAAGSKLYARRMSDGILFRRDGSTWKVVQSNFFDSGQKFRNIIGVSHGIFALRTDGQSVVYIPNGDGFVSTTQVGGPAAQVYACPGETVCATNPDTSDIWMFNRAGNFWTWLGGPGKRFVRTGERLYALTPNGRELVRWSSASGWVGLLNTGTAPGLVLTDLMSSSSEDAVFTRLAATPYRWQGGSTVSALNINGVHQLEARTGNVFVITLDKSQVFKQNGTSWSFSAGAVVRLYPGPNNTTVGLALDDNIWQFNGSTWINLGKPN